MFFSKRDSLKSTSLINISPLSNERGRQQPPNMMVPAEEQGPMQGLLPAAPAHGSSSAVPQQQRPSIKRADKILNNCYQ